MAGNGRHRADESLMANLAAGTSVQEAAVKAGVGERTAFRRLNDPKFRQRLAETKGRMLEAVSTRLVASAGRSLRRAGAAVEEGRIGIRSAGSGTDDSGAGVTHA